MVKEFNKMINQVIKNKNIFSGIPLIIDQSWLSVQSSSRTFCDEMKRPSTYLWDMLRFSLQDQRKLMIAWEYEYCLTLQQSTINIGTFEIGLMSTLKLITSNLTRMGSSDLGNISDNGVEWPPLHCTTAAVFFPTSWYYFSYIFYHKWLLELHIYNMKAGADLCYVFLWFKRTEFLKNKNIKEIPGVFCNSILTLLYWFWYNVILSCLCQGNIGYVS